MHQLNTLIAEFISDTVQLLYSISKFTLSSVPPKLSSIGVTCEQLTGTDGNAFPPLGPFNVPPWQYNAMEIH